ncbi:hypothetical protein RJ640_007493, partial [Escallonia rubra]
VNTGKVSATIEIQCITPKTKLSISEVNFRNGKWNGTNSYKEDGNVEYDDMDNKSDASDSTVTKSVGSLSSNRVCGPGEPGSRRPFGLQNLLPQLCYGVPLISQLNIVVQSLMNAILRGRVASLYLFQGPRGTGKTSTARVLAAALNCLASNKTKPCGLRSQQKLGSLRLKGSKN